MFVYRETFSRVYKHNINSLFPFPYAILALSIRVGRKSERKKRPKRIGEPTSITSFAFSRCISRSASWIPSRDRPREYRLSWPLDTIPDPFAITRMHRTQRQCFETIRDCRLHGVTSTCTYTCTHADTSTRHSIIATSLLHFTSRSRLRATTYSMLGAAFVREDTRRFTMIFRFSYKGRD